MPRLIPTSRGLISAAVGALMMISQPALSLGAPSPITPANVLTSPLAATTITATHTLTLTRTSTPTHTPTPTRTLAPTHTSTPTHTPTPTRTLAPTLTYTPVPTFTPLPTFTLLPPAPPPSPTIAPAPMANVDSPNWPLTVIIGGLVLLFMLLIALWLRSRRRRQRHVQPTEPVPVVTPPAPVASLEFTDASSSIVRFALNKPVLTLGRSGDNDLIIPDSIPNADTVSHHHAQIRRDQEDYIVRDLGSPNGLTVNGRHTNQNLLQDGDRLGFGGTEAIFRKPTPGSAA